MTLSPERKARVPSDFDVVARRYDLLTALNPGYRKHLRWSAERMALAPGARVLDLCCGTGLSTAALVYACPDANIDALDASEGMLEVARRKGLGPRVRFIRGDAMDPMAAGIEGPYDGVLMAYGIRNMPDPDHVLDVIRDLLKPGGIACFHEYSVADSLRAQLVWRAVTRAIIIPAGLVASGTAEIYRYLRDSVLEFDGVRDFEARLRRAGFSRVRTEAMDGWQRGIVHSFLGRRP
ncbi:MAG: class I SAM-dependent methyltransferase [Myxococcota bacterium]